MIQGISYFEFRRDSQQQLLSPVRMAQFLIFFPFYLLNYAIFANFAV